MDSPFCRPVGLFRFRRCSGPSRARLTPACRQAGISPFGLADVRLAADVPARLPATGPRRMDFDLVFIIETHLKETSAMSFYHAAPEPRKSTACAAACHAVALRSFSEAGAKEEGGSYAPYQPRSPDRLHRSCRHRQRCHRPSAWRSCQRVRTRCSTAGELLGRMLRTWPPRIGPQCKRQYTHIPHRRHMWRVPRIDSRRSHTETPHSMRRPRQ